jgi:hypothetical protein
LACSGGELMKRMKVSAPRLRRLLTEAGYHRGFRAASIPSFTFVRRSKISGLYESIIVDAGGKEAEAVGASVGVAITKVVMYKFLGEVQPLREVAEVKDRIHTIIRTTEKAMEWEKELARIAPDLNLAWAQERGPVVLERTKEVRSVVDAYVARLDLSRPRSELLEEMRSQSDPRTLDLAERMFESGGRGSDVTDEAYQLACLAIVRLVDVVEPERLTMVRKSPLVEHDLMHRIYILADRLITWNDLSNVQDGE